MSKERIRFYPFPASNPNTVLYDNLLEKLRKSSHLKEELKKAQNSKKKLLKLIHQLLWKFFSDNRNELELRIRNYFTINKKIGHTLLWKTFMSSSYENSEPQNTGFVIEVADLICKYIENNLSMTFYEWTNSVSPNDLEKYLTSYNKMKKITSLDHLYKLNQITGEPRKKKKKKKRKKRKIKEQIFMFGKNSQVIKKQIIKK